MSDTPTRAFDLIGEISKQIITLSTGFIALGITFNKDFVASSSGCGKVLLVISWTVFIFAIIFSVLTLMACAGVLGKSDAKTPPDPYSQNLRVLGGVQILLFLAGIIVTVIAGGIILCS